MSAASRYENKMEQPANGSSSRPSSPVKPAQSGGEEDAMDVDEIGAMMAGVKKSGVRFLFALTP